MDEERARLIAKLTEAYEAGQLNEDTLLGALGDINYAAAAIKGSCHRIVVDQTMNHLDKAIEIAATAHAGQKDKAGAFYILHPLRLMFKMETEAEMIVAVLHDVVEDCDAFSLARLREEGFSEEVLEALDCVTKREGEGYEDFIGRAEKNELAAKVKMADLEDNLRPLRIAELEEQDLKRLEKYHKAYRRLEVLEFGEV